MKVGNVCGKQTHNDTVNNNLLQVKKVEADYRHNDQAYCPRPELYDT